MFGKQLARRIHTSVPRLLAESAPQRPVIGTPVPVASPTRKVGALRGGFTGFLFGVALTGGAAYYYLLDEYNAGQQAILADVITLRTSLRELNEQVTALKKDTKE